MGWGKSWHQSSPPAPKSFQDNLKRLQAATDQKTQGCNTRIFSISGFSGHDDDIRSVPSVEGSCIRYLKFLIVAPRRVEMSFIKVHSPATKVVRFDTEWRILLKSRKRVQHTTTWMWPDFRPVNSLLFQLFGHVLEDSSCLGAKKPDSTCDGLKLLASHPFCNLPSKGG